MHLIHRSLSVVTLASSSLLCSVAQSEHSYVPPSGFVPDKATALRIAEAVLVPIYGQHVIDSERPFSATLEGKVWKVEGHLAPEVSFGGVAEIWINKTDGKILRVTHGK